MKIGEKTFVAIDYTLSLDSGEKVDSSPEGEPLSFVTGMGRVLPGLEAALMGKADGESTKVTLEAAEAYGEVNEDLLRDIPKSQFPKDVEIEVGMTFSADSPRGPMPLTVAKIGEDDITVDLNHPMAGKRLHFDVKIAEVRKALEEELAQQVEGCGCGGGEAEGEMNCGPDCACG